MEFINMRWKKEGLVEYVYSSRPDVIKEEFLYDVYLHTGVFGDVWRKKNQSLRLFATIGVSIDFLFGGMYEMENKCRLESFGGNSYCMPQIDFTTSIYDTKNTTISATLPIQLGARYYFAQNHGIEVFAKYHALSWNFTQSYTITNASASLPNFITNISRGASVGVRYVFEYK